MNDRAQNPRLTIHPVSVQQIPPSSASPKKRLSHATKFITGASGIVRGVCQPIPRRFGR